MIAYAFGTLDLIVISDRKTSAEKKNGKDEAFFSPLGASHHITLPLRWLAKAYIANKIVLKSCQPVLTVAL